MSASVLAAEVELANSPPLDVKAWRADLVSRLSAGQRPVTLYARRVGDDALLTAVLQAERTLEVTRAQVPVSHGYHELTSSFPALHCFEREMHEQTSLRIADHPWLKPLRYEGQDQAAMASYPWYRVEGAELHEVAVGPIHAGVIEPGAFRFMCQGEQVRHLEIQLGYQHRGVERRLLVGDPRRLTPLVETIAGDTSVAHAWAFCAGLERLAGGQLDDETELTRAFMLELERVAMHLAGLAGLAADVGFLQGASTYGRLRTTAINTSMMLCGSRFGRGALRPGGVVLRRLPELRTRVAENLALLRTDLALINEHFAGARTVRHRLSGVGVLSTARAREIGVVGLAARASGVALDARTQAPGAWAQVPVVPAVAAEGDCQARAQVRMAEMDVSLAWLEAALARGVGGVPPRGPLGALAPRRLVVSVVEGWRGEVVHCLETGGEGELVHAKVQDPSLRNWLGLALAVRQNEISDFPICNKSFDLSYCGNDL